jgi:hypothetical protein
MSTIKSAIGVFAFLAASFYASVNVFAGAWDSAHLFDDPDKTVRRIVVTGNFVKPRLIAELARKETKTPYLLFPAPGDNRIFFCPGGKGPALEIREADLSRFVEFVGPKQLIVLGDPRFVPQYYLSALGANCETIVIDSDNWFTNATTLGNLLNYKSLPERYKSSLERMDAGKWDLERRPEQPAQGQQPEAFREPSGVERSNESMSLMPPSQGKDEPVLLVPSKTATRKW